MFGHKNGQSVGIDILPKKDTEITNRHRKYAQHQLITREKHIKTTISSHSCQNEIHRLPVDTQLA